MTICTDHTDTSSSRVVTRAFLLCVLISLTAQLGSLSIGIVTQHPLILNWVSSSNKIKYKDNFCFKTTNENLNYNTVYFGANSKRL